MSTRDNLSIFTGQNAAVRLVSHSHGSIRPNLVDSFDFTPKRSTKRIDEYDNSVSALLYTTFDGGTGKLGYTETNQGQLNAALMDLDPSTVETMENPALYKPFTAFANLKGLDGKVKGCVLLHGCEISDNPFTSTVKEGAKRSLSFEFLQGFKFDGMAMLYTRCRGALTQQAAPAQPALVSAGTGGVLGVGTYYVQITAITASGETDPSNEAVIQITSGATNKITATIPAIVAPVTAYNVYVWNKSNGARFFVQDAVGGGPLDITALPSESSAKAPASNDSGVFAATSDKVYTLGGGVYSATLDKAAYKLGQSRVDYVHIRRNGAALATLDSEAAGGYFAFDAAGAVFSVLDADAPKSWYDVFTLYQP